jgi:membrane-associated phospholipid phosphatase
VHSYYGLIDEPVRAPLSQYALKHVTLLIWHKASLAFFVYVLAILIGRRSWTGRSTRAVAGVLAGLAIVSLAALVQQPAVLVEWVWPPLVLLIAYWTSGLLFVIPSPSQERALLWLDERLRVREIAGRTPRLVADLFELAYVAVYPLIPIALCLHLTYAPDASADRFWTIVLATDFVCFGVLPWVQTRPPRALESGDPWRSAVRPLNLRLLGSTSIHVNTFPSGHAAEALAAALLSLDAPLPLVAAMFAAAVAVSAGAVLGRYHYLADVLTGWLAALLVWAAV